MLKDRVANIFLTIRLFSWVIWAFPVAFCITSWEQICEEYQGFRRWLGGGRWDIREPPPVCDERISYVHGQESHRDSVTKKTRIAHEIA